MTRSTVAQTMDRISIATSESPIAVFRLPDGGLDTLFGGSITAKQRIADSPETLIGVFDRTMDQHDIRAALGEPVPRRPKPAATRGPGRPRMDLGECEPMRYPPRFTGVC